MSSLPEEHREGLAERQERRRTDRLTQLRFLHGQAESMSELLGDPKWEIYGRQVDIKRDACRAVLATLKAKLENAFLNPQEYGETKVKQAYNQGCCDGLDFALDIAKRLAEDVEKYLKEIKSLQND